MKREVALAAVKLSAAIRSLAVGDSLFLRADGSTLDRRLKSVRVAACKVAAPTGRIIKVRRMADTIEVERHLAIYNIDDASIDWALVFHALNVSNVSVHVRASAEAARNACNWLIGVRELPPDFQLDIRQSELGSDLVRLQNKYKRPRRFRALANMVV
jgi:uncharacterized membrane protein